MAFSSIIISIVASLSVTATDDKGLKGIAGVIYTTSGTNKGTAFSKTMSGTSSTQSATIDISSLADGNYKIKFASLDNADQVSSYVYYYYFNKGSGSTPPSKPVITNFRLEGDGEGTGRLKAIFNISSSASLTTLKAHCSTSSSVSHSSSYDYKNGTASLSTGSKIITLSDSDWIGDKIYCEIEARAGYSNLVESNILSINLSNIPVVIPTDAPRLSRPYNSSTVDDTTPKYSWRSVNNANYYKLTVYSTDGTRIATERQVYGTYTSLRSSDRLTIGKTYKWRVRACNSNRQCGPYSDIYSFDVE